MRKKILFIIESLNCGGAEKSLVSLLPQLDTAKYDIYLWIMYRGGIFEKLLPQNIHLVQFDLYKRDSIWDNLLYCLCKIKYSVVYRFNKFFGIKRHNAEVLWNCMHSVYRKQSDAYDVAIAYQQGLPTYLLKDHINAKKKIGWINADIFSVGYDSDFNYQKYSNYDYLIAVSDILKEKITQKWPDIGFKVQSIYDIINPNIVKKLARETPVVEIECSVPVFLTVGRLVELKGYDLLLDAAAILKSRKVRFKWYIIGEGGMRTFIDSEIRKKGLEQYIILLGLRDNPYPYMQACDMYIQTSKCEGFGMAVAEAKILCKPIVSTNYPVVYNLLQHKVNGLIVDMNGAAIADGIQFLQNNANIQEHIIQNLQQGENTTYKTESLKLEYLLDED